MLLPGIGRQRYRDAEHLPQRRSDGQAPHPHTLPRQRHGTTPQMVGRYPDYDVMDEAHAWDPATRGVVEQRLQPHGSLRFFTEEEAPAVHAFCDTVLAQDDEPRVPVVAMIDAKMAERRFDGYRYADMPDDDVTWRISLRGLDEVACRRYTRPFAECSQEVRESLCEQFSKGELEGDAWTELNVKRAWSVLMRNALSAFYAHPWAWNEIGFGGPAYPRGYMRLGEGLREPFEKPEAVHDDPVREESYPQT
jgi:hypothetical protein